MDEFEMAKWVAYNLLVFYETQNEFVKSW
jgi:hypothetical protein